MRLKNKQIVFHVKRYAMSNVYISADESMDLLDNLNPTEHRLYIQLNKSVLVKPTPEYFSSTNLAKLLGTSVSTLDNAKSSLKRKGYALIAKFKDENGNPMVRVVVGKDQVELYNLGIMVEITDAKGYREISQKYDLLNPSLSKDEQEERVRQINEEYKLT